MNPRALALISVIVVGIVVALLVSKLLAAKRQASYVEWATSHGWSHDDGVADLTLRDEFEFIDEFREGDGHFRRGTNHYGIDALRGHHGGRDAIAFTYHFEEFIDNANDADRNTPTSKYHSIVALRLEAVFPKLRLSKETRLSRLGQQLLGDDIDIDTAPEFSNRFEVRSPREDFARDFLHQQMIDSLMSRPIDTIQLEGQWIASVAKGRLDVDEIDARLDHLHQIRELMPLRFFGTAS